MNYFVIPGIPKPDQKPKEFLFVHPERIKASIMMWYDKPFDFFQKTSRKQEECYPRQVLVYLLKNYSHLNYRQILEFVGKETHTDVIHACNAVKNYIATDKRIRKEVYSIIENF